MISPVMLHACTLAGALLMSANAAVISLHSADSTGIRSAVIGEAGELGRNSNLYVGALYGGQLYLRGADSKDWRLYQGGSLPMAARNYTFSANGILPLTDFDPATLVGLEIYAGFGANESELFLPGHIFKVYVVPATPIQGACGSANGRLYTAAPSGNLCLNGVATALLGSGPWTWRCIGSANGSTASCASAAPAEPVEGSCGSSNGALLSSIPTSGLCTAGSPGTVSGLGPWSWSCTGSNNGKSATCFANKAPAAINGNCGSANGMAFTSSPTAGLCQAGTASVISGSGPWAWSCSGSNNGSSASCGAGKTVVSVSGVCGTANGALFSSLPTSGLCDAGSASAVGGSGPWTWSCSGAGTGSNATCNAQAAYPLTATVSGAGSLTSSPAGISCGAACSASFAAGSNVTLNAVAAAGSTFTGWGGACSGTAATCTVAMSAARSVGASFAPVSVSPISLSMVPSRVSGVAPLSIFFDASGTTSTATSLPFHEIKYAWNFGDATAGAWAFGTRPNEMSRNAAYGAVAAHVFETPGTYTVTLTAFDGTHTSTQTTTVTVTDPNSVYAGTRTVCIANGTLPVAGVNGCPAGAAVANLATTQQIVDMAASAGNRRVLLKRGDSWDVAFSIIQNGNGTLGAYGVGAPPLLRFTSNNYGFAVAAGVSNWTFMDLDFAGAGGIGVPVATSGSKGSNITALRIRGTGVGGFSVGGDGVFVVDSDLSNLAGGSGYVGIYSEYSSRVALLGNRIHDATHIEHNIRTQGSTKVVISNNSLYGPAETKQAITVRGRSVYGQPEWSGVWVEHIVVSDNDIDAGPNAGQLVEFAPQNPNRDERVRDVVFERNYVHGATGTLLVSEVCERATFRNNLFVPTDNGTYAYATISVMYKNVAGTPPPTSHFIYNNSFYRPAGAHPKYEAISVGVWSGNTTYPTGTIVKNNLVYAPYSTGNDYNTNPGPTFIGTAGPAGLWTLANNSSDAQIKNTSPNFAGSPPVALTDWRPGNGYAVGGGAVVPVWDDFFLKARTGAYDIGAVLH